MCVGTRSARECTVPRGLLFEVERTIFVLHCVLQDAPSSEDLKGKVSPNHVWNVVRGQVRERMLE